MADSAARKQLALELWQQFSERQHACSALHLRALTLLQENKFDDATKCCLESYRLGLTTGDSYIRAAARLYSGLILFALKEPMHWGRAQDYCEESAALFHAVGERAAESAAWWSVAQIADAHTAAGYDSAHRALPAYLRVLAPDAETPEELEALAQSAYARSVNQIGTKGAVRLAASQSEPVPQPKASDTAPKDTAPKPAPEIVYLPSPIVRVPANTLAIPRTFSRLELFTLAMLILDGLLACALVGSGFWYLWTQFPQLRLVLILCAALLVLATAVPTAIYWGGGQLVFRLRNRQAAVLRARGKWLADEKTGWHFVVPFMESLEAMIPLARRRLNNCLFDIRAPDGYSFLARVNVVFRVTNAAWAWMRLRQRIHRRRILGMEEVAGAALCAQALDDWVYASVSEALSQLAGPALRPSTQQPGEQLNRATFQLLEAEMLLTGLQIYLVEVNPYHSKG